MKEKCLNTERTVVPRPRRVATRKDHPDHEGPARLPVPPGPPGLEEKPFPPNLLGPPMVRGPAVLPNPTSPVGPLGPVSHNY